MLTALAFFFGYALTTRGVLRGGVGLRRALRLALAADTAVHRDDGDRRQRR